MFDFYKNKKVLITGHTGFKGSWLAFWLHNLKADVYGYSLAPPTDPCLFEILNLSGKINHNSGDILDSEKLNLLFQEIQPEIVFHLAAQPIVRRSYIIPKLTYETNVIGTINVLEAIRNTKSVKSAVVVTSDKCYENTASINGYRESDPMGGYDPYSSSKGCTELVVSAYRKSFYNVSKYGDQHQVAIASARAGNVIGGGDWAEDRLIPDCAKSISRDEEIIIRNPVAVRPWQHVLEPLAGYLLLGRQLFLNGSEYSSAWNFGPNEEDAISVEEVVRGIIKEWGRGSFRIEADKIFHEEKYLKLNIDKAKNLLGWNPAYSVSEAIDKTTDWYKNYYDHKEIDIVDFTRSQIEEYENKIKK